MSWIVLPDEYPGRCRNFRNDMTPNGPVMQRCLEREDDLLHHCRFSPVSVPAHQVSWSTLDAKKTKPEPWVPPPREEN